MPHRHDNPAEAWMVPDVSPAGAAAGCLLAIIAGAVLVLIIGLVAAQAARIAGIVL